MTLSTPQWPQEIVDYTLDFLHDNKEALRQCSLVCKAWEPSSTFHLFSTFSWPPCGHWWDSYTGLRRSGGSCICHIDEGTFEHCAELISSIPRMAHAIRHLRLSAARTTGEPGMGSGVEVSGSPVLDMIRASPNLRHLELYDCRLDAKSFGIAELESIPELSIIWRHMPCRPCMFDLTLAFKHIHKLYIHTLLGWDIGDDDFSRTYLHQHRPSITNIDLQDASTLDDNRMTLQTLRTHLDLTSLQHLAIRSEASAELDTILLSAPAITSLAYNVGGGTPKLHHSVHLRKLVLGGYLDPEQHPCADWMRMMRDMQQFTNPHIEHVGLTWRIQEMPFIRDYRQLGSPSLGGAFVALQRDLEKQDWAQFDRILSNCPRLRMICIRLELIRDHEYSMGEMAEDLPRCLKIVRKVAVERLKGVRQTFLQVVVADCNEGGRVLESMTWQASERA